MSSASLLPILLRPAGSGDSMHLLFVQEAASESSSAIKCATVRSFRDISCYSGLGSMVEVDICVLGEMFMRRPILPGTSDLDQLEKIWILCGSPNQHSWPDFDSLPGCEGIKRFSLQPRKLKPSYEQSHREGDLRPLGPPVDVQPARPHHGLDHDYFWTDPMPADPKTFVATSLSTPVADCIPHQLPGQQQQQQQQQQHANGPPTHAHLHQADPQRQYRAPPPNSVPPPHMNGSTASNPNNWGLPSNPHQQAFNKRLPPWPGGPPPPHGKGHGAPPPGQ
ncbi:hypothetical protein C8J57DRAFT_1520571 [Mycena rebaudengoi]|nr:hypothetical protein C8J57DRAFT_1520571 [Mycena rebaudengoi]